MKLSFYLIVNINRANDLFILSRCTRETLKTINNLNKILSNYIHYFIIYLLNNVLPKFRIMFMYIFF